MKKSCSFFDSSSVLLLLLYPNSSVAWVSSGESGDLERLRFAVVSKGCGGDEVEVEGEGSERDDISRFR